MLPVDLINAYDSLSSLRQSNDEWRYEFMAEDNFLKLLNDDTVQAAEVYWKEMLYRTHIVCLVSAFKTLRWIEALDSNFENYYGFCSSLRGLLESCTDTFYTLRSVPLTIARDFFVIKEQISRRSNVFTTHAPLEDLLLHYIQATKLSRSQMKQHPNTFAAKQITEYLSTMDDEDLLGLYQWLCGISHPSCESTRTLLFHHEGQAIVCNDSFEMEKMLVRQIFEIHGPSLSRMMRTYMNNIVSVFYLLNEFGIENLIITTEAEAQFKQSDIWKEVQGYMNESEILYAQGEYEKKV